MNKKMKPNKNVKSIVGKDAIFEGAIETKEIMRIDGVVKGDIKSESTLIIGESGKIIGEIHASKICIAGEVDGDLFATERIEATATGRIKGNIKTKSLVIDENAVFQGMCEMNVTAETESENTTGFVQAELSY